MACWRGATRFEAKVRVHLYTIVWNEEEMLPFFFRHYDALVDRYVVYDDGSTDRTLDMLAAHGRVEVRRFERTVPDSFVLSAKSLHDHIWKESRGVADWVIITAVDEHLYHPGGLGPYLEKMGSAGVTAVPALAFQMAADAFPLPHEHLAHSQRIGVPLDRYNKLSIFNPDAINETHYEVGRHSAAPAGRMSYPERDELLLLHYKFLGIDYVRRRYALLSTGLGAGDRARRYGFQYDLPALDLAAQFDRLRNTAFDVTSPQAQAINRVKWWRRNEPSAISPG
jgi:Glycosyl transferase family 2